MKVTLNNIEDSILPLVSKPNRYLGNFEGARRKEGRQACVKVALAFPDCYDLGMSHLGIKILYRIINDRDDSLAELVFAPWPDMEEKMREHGLPLFTLETRTPVSDFDVIGFSLQYELHYTTVLNMLDLAGTPLHSKDRGEDHPLVIAGGPCAFSPEPMAPFIDAFLIGDGEEAIGEILDAVFRRRREGESREGLLRELAAIRGVYVPALYDTTPNSLGHLVPVPAGDAPARIEAARIKNISSSKTQPAHLVSLTDIAHSRLSVEVMRGCPRSCRFCMPGSIYHPVRRKAEEDVLFELRNGMASGGWGEVSLLSLSTSDYKGISGLVQNVSKMFLGQGVNISLPSIRPGTLPPQLARSLTYVRKSGLTFAPEAGSERLRRVIDKGITEEEIIESVKVAAAAGWNSVKLYFMVGLPTETDEDVRAIGRLALELRKGARRAGKKMGLKISIAGFVPKAHTPFQWEQQLDMETMASRISALNRMLRPKGLRVRWRDVETTYLEGLLSRGDRKLGDVVHAAWKGGCRFDGWTDFLNFEKWKQAIVETGVEPASYSGPRQTAESLPWSHIGFGTAVEGLLRERDRSRSGEAREMTSPVPKSKFPFCERASEAGGEAKIPGEAGAGPAAPRGRADAVSEGLNEGSSGTSQFNTAALYGRGRKKTRGHRSQMGAYYRLQYEKLEPVRFISHLDVVRAFDRAIRKAGLPIAFSMGFAKHPKLAFGPPLALGMTSVAEYLDMEFLSPQTDAFGQLLSECLPYGLTVLRSEPHRGSKPTSLMSAISHADFSIRLPDCAIEGIQDVGSADLIGEAFNTAEGLLRGDVPGAGRGDGNTPGWRDIVVEGNVIRGDHGLELFLRVRLDVKRGPKIREIGAALLSGVDLDPRLLRVERKALWVERSSGLASPLDALNESLHEVAARLERGPGVKGKV